MNAMEKFLEALRADAQLQDAVEEADSAEALLTLAAPYGVTMEQLSQLLEELE